MWVSVDSDVEDLSLIFLAMFEHHIPSTGTTFVDIMLVQCLKIDFDALLRAIETHGGAP
jgi:hypothetical protein